MSNPYSAQQAQNLLGDSLAAILALRERLPEIVSLAQRLTPVEDLVRFKHQIEQVHGHLDLLVEASEIIIQATDVGFDLLTSRTPAIARSVLELGTAALKDEDFFATATAFNLLQEQVNNLADSLADTIESLQVEAAKVATLQSESAEHTRLHQLLEARVVALELLPQQIGGIGDQIGGIIGSISDLTQKVEGNTDNIAAVASANQETRTLLTDLDGVVTSTSQSVLTLQASLNNLSNGLEGVALAVDDVTARVTATENSMTVESQRTTALEARATNLEATTAANAMAVGNLSTQVTATETNYLAVATEQTQLRSDYQDLANDISVVGTAQQDLISRTEVTEGAIVVLTEQSTQLVAELAGSNNQLRNTDFMSGLAGWSIDARGQGWEDAQLTRNLYPDTYVPEGLSTLGVAVGQAVGGAITILSDFMAITPSTEYMVSGYIAGIGMTVTLEYVLYDQYSNEILTDGFVGQATAGDGGKFLRMWPHHFKKFNAPANADMLRLRITGYAPTGSEHAVLLLRPMVEQAKTGQTKPSAYVPGSIDVDSAVAQANQDLYARLEATEAGLSGAVGSITQLGIDLQDKASLSALNSLTGEVNDINDIVTVHTQQINSISAEVSLDGTNANMLTNSTFVDGMRGWTATSGVESQYTTMMGHHAFTDTAVGIESVSQAVLNIDGRALTAAVDVFRNNLIGSMRLELYTYDAADVLVAMVQQTSDNVAISKWRRITATVQANAAAVKAVVRLVWEDTSGIHLMRQAKLETGTEASRYSDESDRKATADAISTMSADVDSLGNAIATLEDTTTTNINGAISTANSALTAANNAASVAATASVAAGDAQSTATTALSTAAGVASQMGQVQTELDGVSVSVTEVSEVVNRLPVAILTNPGFEDGLSGWSLTASGSQPPPANMYVYENLTQNYQRSGNRAARLNYEAGLAGAQAIYNVSRTPVVPGEQVRIGCYVRSIGTNPTSGSAIGVGIQFRRADFSWVSGQNVTVRHTANGSSFNFTELTQVATVPPEAVFCNLYIFTSNHTGGHFLIDDVYLEYVNRTAQDLRASVIGGGNLLTDSTFSDPKNWVITWNSSGWGVLSKNLAGSNYYPPGINTLGASRTGTTTSVQYLHIGTAVPLAVTAGKTYILSAYGNPHRATQSLFVIWNNTSGTEISRTAAANAVNHDGAGAAGNNLAVNWERVYSIGVAPAGAVTAILVFRTAAPAGVTTPYTFWARPMFEEASPAQTLPSPWSAGGKEMAATHTISLDVNGYVSGTQSVNDGERSSFKVHADLFEISKPGGGARTEFSNGNWRVYDANGVLRVRMGVW